MTLIRTIVVLVTIAGATAVGIAGASWGDPKVAGMLVLGVVPVMWGAVRLLKRSIGRDIWRFDAPYPYRWMSNDIDEQIERQTRQNDQVKRSGATVPDAWERPAAA